MLMFLEGLLYERNFETKGWGRSMWRFGEDNAENIEKWMRTMKEVIIVDWRISFL